MEISFYNTISPDEKVDKDLVLQTTLNGYLKAQTSMEEPVIVVETSSVPATWNYAYIPDFARSYFVRGRSSVKNNIWELEMEEDYIGSWKAGIRLNNAILRRSATMYNTYLKDDQLPLYQDKFTIDYPINTEFGFNPSNFYLTVAGYISDSTRTS